MDKVLPNFQFHRSKSEIVNGIRYPAGGTASRFIWDKCDEWFRKGDMDSTTACRILMESTGLARNTIVCQISKWRTATNKHIPTARELHREQEIERLLAEFLAIAGREYRFRGLGEPMPRDIKRAIESEKKYQRRNMLAREAGVKYYETVRRSRMRAHRK